MRAVRRPFVIVEAVASHVQHVVDVARAAEALAAVPRADLRHVPHNNAEQTDRQTDGRTDGRTPSLRTQNRAASGVTKRQQRGSCPRAQQASGRKAATT